ncbi:MAG: hypothetical protein PVG42_15835, partial [Lysobacterales bacterium]
HLTSARFRHYGLRYAHWVVMRQQPKRSPKARWFRLAGMVMIFIGVSVSWALVAEFLLEIEPVYWLWLPLGLAAVFLYWFLAWGSIADKMEDIDNRRERWTKGAGCMVVALLVFLLICVLLGIFFLK